MTARETAYAERWFHAQDGLRLHYREYGDDLSHRTPVLCLTGLTRNASDFHPLATRLAPQRRVLCMDYRGRGKSAYDSDWRSYQPATYIRDVQHLLAVAGVHRAVLVGTSLGGLVTMGLAAAAPSAIAGAVLNDIGPEVAENGRARIAAYVGQEVRMPDWPAAGAAWKTQFGNAYPDLSDERWAAYARNIFVEDPQTGDLRLDYDLNIARALQEQARQPLPDMWKLFGALRDIPVLAIRGALSDVLSQACFDRMLAEKPDLIRVTVPNRGHVPLLDEPECLAAIDAFLARF